MSTGLDHGFGACATFLKGPRIYAIDGVNVSVALVAMRYRYEGAVYVDVFWDADYGLMLGNMSKVFWRPVGRVVVPTVVEATTPPLAGNYSDRIYFNIQFVFAWRYGCTSTFLGQCYVERLLYPRWVGGIDLGIWVSGLGNTTDGLKPYKPLTSIPPNANPRFGGAIEIPLYAYR